MKQIALLIILTMTFQAIPATFGATKSCSNEALTSLLQLSIGYNENRANFLKLLIYVNASNDGIVKSRNEGDLKGEVAWQKNYDSASTYALGWANKGLQIEKNIRNALGKCRSGYGVNYSLDNGFIAMDKKIKGIRFLSFKIPALITIPIANSNSAAPTATEENKTAQNSGVGKKCVVGTSCLIGSTGPGGGEVFYDAGSQQSWGRYLEFAPKGWSGQSTDPQLIWCDLDKTLVGNIVSYEVLTEAKGSQIGKGKSNTDTIVSKCSTGAGVEARRYTGGGKLDWSLPSIDELNELCKYAGEQAGNQARGDIKVGCRGSGKNQRGGFTENNYYWSSSERDEQFTWQQALYGGGTSSPWKNVLNGVRPVRAF